MDQLLPWQRIEWELMMERKTQHRLPHAVLCHGVLGLGKRLFAERLAQALLCEQPHDLPCGLCRACRLFLAGNHPDYVRIEPAEGTKIIKVDQIRDLCAFLGYTSKFGGYKIAVLDPAERMNINAVNSLLKTLEEPPPNSLLLLVSAALSKLPATVRSRCQMLAFREPDPQQAARWLAAQLADSAVSSLLLSLAGGAPLLALAYGRGNYLLRRGELFDSFRELLSGKADPVRTAERWIKPSAIENLRWLVGCHIDMIRLKMVEDPPRLFNPDLRKELRQLAGNFSLQGLFAQLDEAIQMQELCLTPINQQLMLESFFADCVSQSTARPA
jgi:DNA polymerase-3 subunit delta'